MSWNATGIMTGIPYLCDQLKNNNITICGLSEHWLLSHNAHILNNVDSNYSSHTVTCASPSTLNGRLIGKGGVALLWHKSVDSFVETIHIESDRIAALKLCLPNQTLVIVQVYLPCSNHSIETFKNEVDILSDLCNVYSNISNIVIMGDFNAKFVKFNRNNKYMRTRDVYVSVFANNMNLTAVTTSEICGGSKVSFVPYGNGSPSLIDHILVDESLLSCIKNCAIKADSPLNVSRHLSLHITFVVNTTLVTNTISAKFEKINYQWKKSSELQRYEQNVAINLSRENIDYENINETYEKIIQ